MKFFKSGPQDQCFFEDSQEQHQEVIQEKSQQKRKTKSIQSPKKQTVVSKNQLATKEKPEIKNNRKHHTDQLQENSEPNQQKGRPGGNDLEGKHLGKSRQLNNILQHYSKLLIFFYFMKASSNSSAHSFSLQVHQNDWMNQAAQIMSRDNFPSSLDKRNQYFLLHPNSLHFIFEYNKMKQITKYSSDKIKFYFFAFLNRRKLLTNEIFNYICQYWTDIICLVGEWTFKEKNDRKALALKQRYIQCEQYTEESSNTRMGLLKQLNLDQSIAAYEVACYLKSCCDHYGIQIASSKRQ